LLFSSPRFIEFFFSSLIFAHENFVLNAQFILLLLRPDLIENFISSPHSYLSFSVFSPTVELEVFLKPARTF